LRAGQPDRGGTPCLARAGWRRRAPSAAQASCRPWPQLKMWPEMPRGWIAPQPGVLLRPATTRVPGSTQFVAGRNRAFGAGARRRAAFSATSSAREDVLAPRRPRAQLGAEVGVGDGDERLGAPADAAPPQVGHAELGGHEAHVAAARDHAGALLEGDLD